MQGDSGATPLFAACLAGHPDVVKLLLSRKANPNRATVCRTLLLQSPSPSVVGVRAQRFSSSVSALCAISAGCVCVKVMASGVLCRPSPLAHW